MDSKNKTEIVSLKIQVCLFTLENINNPNNNIDKNILSKNFSTSLFCATYIPNEKVRNHPKE